VLTSDQVLNELDFLATVEHALIVECLSVHCALGHDLKPGDGGPTPPASDAANLASQLAQGQMSHLRNINTALITARRLPQLGRATSISSASVAAIPLDPPSVAQLQDLLAREEGIARAVDERYARLVPAVTSAAVFDGDLLNDLRSVIVSASQSHTAAFAGFRDALGDVAPADVLRATRRETAGDFEERLLDASDRAYALTIEILNYQFTAPDDSEVPFRQVAVEAMTSLDDMNCVLAQRGLLPRFTLPSKS
jgi:hypothetical protein